MNKLLVMALLVCGCGGGNATVMQHTNQERFSILSNQIMPNDARVYVIMDERTGQEFVVIFGSGQGITMSPKNAPPAPRPPE